MLKQISFAVLLLTVVSSCKQRTCTCKDVTGATTSVSTTRGGSQSSAQQSCDSKQVGGQTCTLS